MTISKSLAVAGLALFAVTAAKAVDPTVKLVNAGAKTGQKASLQVIGVPNGKFIQSAVIALKFDTTNAAVAASASDFVVGPGWVRNDFSVTGDTVLIQLSNTTDDPGGSGHIGQKDTGPIVTVMVTNNATGLKSSTLTLDPSTNIGDDEFNSYYIAAQTASLLPGPFKSLGTNISGAPSVGPGGVIAVVVDNALRLVKTADLTDVAAGLALGGPIDGRPAFGVVGGTAVVAVGDQSGKVTTVNATTGAAVGTAVTVGSKAGTPAIDNATGSIYVGADQTSGAPALVKIAGGATANTPLVGATVKTAPAFFQGGVAIGTDTALQLFRDAGTGPLVQQSVINDAAGFTSSPLIRGDGMGLAASAASGGTVYQFNMLTGTAVGQSLTLPTGTAPLSEGWYDSAADGAWFGGANGSLVNVKFTATGPTNAGLTAGFLTNPINAMPITLGGNTYAIDNTGNLKSTAGAALSVGAPSTKALAATGRTAGTDSLVVATTDGGLALLPF